MKFGKVINRLRYADMGRVKVLRRTSWDPGEYLDTVCIQVRYRECHDDGTVMCDNYRRDVEWSDLVARDWELEWYEENE